jgi:hypothetical protein
MVIDSRKKLLLKSKKKLFLYPNDYIKLFFIKKNIILKIFYNFNFSHSKKRDC